MAVLYHRPCGRWANKATAKSLARAREKPHGRKTAQNMRPIGRMVNATCAQVPTGAVRGRFPCDPLTCGAMPPPSPHTHTSALPLHLSPDAPPHLCRWRSGGARLAGHVDTPAASPSTIWQPRGVRSPSGQSFPDCKVCVGGGGVGGAGHLGLTHTETQQGRLWMA